MFDKVDYRKSIRNVIEYFIQPPVYENQFIVLAPNASTMTGMEVIEASEDQLLSMSECVSYSKPYIDYLCERKKSSPQCLQCLHKLNKTVSGVTPECIMSKMVIIFLLFWGFFLYIYIYISQSLYTKKYFYY